MCLLADCCPYLIQVVLNIQDIYCVTFLKFIEKSIYQKLSGPTGFR